KASLVSAGSLSTRSATAALAASILVIPSVSRAFMLPDASSTSKTLRALSATALLVHVAVPKSAAKTATVRRMIHTLSPDLLTLYRTADRRHDKRTWFP